MTVELAQTFSSLLVEYENLVTLDELRSDLAYNLCTLYCWSTYCYCTLILNEEHLLEFYCVTILSILDVVNVQLLASLYSVLLTFDFYNCVHLN